MVKTGSRTSTIYISIFPMTGEKHLYVSIKNIIFSLRVQLVGLHVCYSFNWLFFHVHKRIYFSIYFIGLKISDPISWFLSAIWSGLFFHLHQKLKLVIPLYYFFLNSHSGSIQWTQASKLFFVAGTLAYIKSSNQRKINQQVTGRSMKMLCL